ncbi:Uncharacterised protein [Klebsiella variicola]|uniref:Uncharacterized protein n=1 Tax=Klebsiella variicola TaxID=244366 RepID=A0A7H4MJB0_KLEVA|nr:Uncharacterised protein [Klebsiella variicola]
MIFSPQRPMIFSPAATLPVMLTIATLWIASQLLTNVSPRPSTRLKTPFGNPTWMDDLGKGDGIIGRKFAWA